MVKRSGRALFAAMFLFACGGNGGDPMIPPGAYLEFVSEPTQNLRFSQTAELTVAYLADGEVGGPIEGASLDWEIIGTAGGSNLAASQCPTNASGECTVRLASGMSETTFRVRVTPPEGESIEFMIGVADFDAGSILVELEYGGMQMFNPIETFLYDGLDCGSVNLGSLPTALASAVPVARITDRPSFANVEARSGYTVLVVARLAGNPAGFGCTEMITVASGEQTTVTVTINDLSAEPQVTGVYELDNRFDFTAGLPGSVGTAITVLDELTDDNDIRGNPSTEDYGQDPGAFFLEVGMRQICKWDCMGVDYDLCEQNHPIGDLEALYTQNFTNWSGAEPAFPGACGVWEFGGEYAQSLINDQIEDLLPGIVTSLAVSLGDVARAINNAQIQSRLIIFPGGGSTPMMRHDLDTMEVTITDLDGMPMTFMINLRDAGFRTGTASFTGTLTGDELQIPMHQFAVNFGELLQFIYTNAVLPALGYTSTAEMLSGWIDCTAIGTQVAEFVSEEIITIDATNAIDACNDGLVLAGRFLDSQLGTLVTTEDGTLSMAGFGTMGDYNAANLATTISDGQWTGNWGELEATEEFSGTFTGMRTGDAPPAR